MFARFMSFMPENNVQNFELKTIAEALTLSLAPETYRQYVDDTHARFKSKEQSGRISNDFK